MHLVPIFTPAPCCCPKTTLTMYLYLLNCKSIKHIKKEYIELSTYHRTLNIIINIGVNVSKKKKR